MIDVRAIRSTVGLLLAAYHGGFRSFSLPVTVEVRGTDTDQSTEQIMAIYRNHYNHNYLMGSPSSAGDGHPRLFLCSSSRSPSTIVTDEII